MTQPTVQWGHISYLWATSSPHNEFPVTENEHLQCSILQASFSQDKLFPYQSQRDLVFFRFYISSAPKLSSFEVPCWNSKKDVLIDIRSDTAAAFFSFFFFPSKYWLVENSCPFSVPLNGPDCSISEEVMETTSWWPNGFAQPAGGES